MKTPKRLGIGVLAVCLSTVEAQGQEVPDRPPEPVPLQLFEEAYHSAANFSPLDQGMILSFLVGAVRPVSTERAKEWAVELFWKARNSRTDSGSMQLSALMALSGIDPVLAAELFAQQQAPTEKNATQDIRWTAAGPLFAALWTREGLDSLETIEQLAAGLGSSGQYPYQAMTGVILDVHKQDENRAQQLFSNATGFFRADSRFLENNQLFVDFLLEARAVPAPAILRHAVETVLAEVEKSAEEKRREEAGLRIELRTQQETLNFTSEEDILIYRLLPLIRQLDVKWAAAVLKRHENLSTYPTLGIETEYAHGGVEIRDPGTSEARVQQAFDFGRMREAVQTAATDPERALSLLERIVTPHLRHIALASIVSRYARVDPAKAAELLGEVEEGLESMETSPDKLRVQVALAEAYLKSERAAAGRGLIRKALDLGRELFRQDRLADPVKPLTATIAFDELVKLASLMGISSEQSWDSLESIRAVQNDVLRTSLLVFFSKGLLESKHGVLQSAEAESY